VDLRREPRGAGCHPISKRFCIIRAVHVTVTAKGVKLRSAPPTPGAEISFKAMFLSLPQTGIVGCVTVTILRILNSKSPSIIIYILFPGYSQRTQRWRGQRQHAFPYPALPVPLPGTGQSCRWHHVAQWCKTRVCATKHHLPQTAAHGTLQALCQARKRPGDFSCCYRVPAVFYEKWQEQCFWQKHIWNGRIYFWFRDALAFLSRFLSMPSEKLKYNTKNKLLLFSVHHHQMLK